MFGLYHADQYSEAEAGTGDGAAQDRGRSTELGDGSVLNEDMEMAKAYLAYRKTVDESKQKTTEKDLEDIYGAYVADLDISRVYLCTGIRPAGAGSQ